MDEFGETATYYIWPKDHEEGDPYPEDFHERVRRALETEGLECEIT